MNIGIFGVGSIGSVIAKYLTLNQAHQYFFFNRSDKKKIKIIFEDQEDSIPVKLSGHQNQKLDWLIICLKAYHIPEALPRMKALISDATNVAIIQNGINLSSPYLPIIQRSKILETIIDCSVQKTASGKLLQLRKPKILIPTTLISNQFIQLFEGTDVDISITENFEAAQWTKLIESSAIGSIQAATSQPCSIFRLPEHRYALSKLISESITVAKSEGLQLPPDLKDQIIEKINNYPAEKGSSMLTDRRAGNQLELGAKIGVIAEIAQRNNIPIPVTQSIYDVLRQYNQSIY